MVEYLYEELKKKGYNPKIITSYLVGEAREIGKAIASIGKMIMKKTSHSKNPLYFFWLGGTVTVKGNGGGGRNQELALSAAMELHGHGEYIVCSIATDGINGIRQQPEQ